MTFMDGVRFGLGFMVAPLGLLAMIALIVIVVAVWSDRK